MAKSEDKKKPDTERVSLRMESIWMDAENRIIQDIVRRIKTYGKITSTADYQINRLKEMGKSTEEIEKILKEALNATWPEMFKLYDDIAEWEYVRNKDIYEQVNREFVPPEDNEWLTQTSESVKEQTKDELTNISQSYGFAVNMNGKTVFMPFAKYYQTFVDAAIMDVITGNFDYNTVLRRVVKQMTDSGLRTVDYASGWSNRTPVAVRRAIMTGISQVTGKISERNAKILGTDHYEVTWHSGARPDHRVWQGKVYTYKQLESVCGLGTVTGLHGANCRHDYYPFIPGISERLYTDEWLDEQNRKESIIREWHGKQLDAYGVTQQQRKMETAMRAQRSKIAALKKGDYDPDKLTLEKAKYQGQLYEYTVFSNKMGIPQQRERIYMDGLGRLAPNTKKYQKYLKEKEASRSAVKSVAKSGKDAIIKIDAQPGSAKYREIKRQKIIEKGVSENKPIFASDLFGKVVANVPVKKDRYDVALHGTPKYAVFYGERINAGTLADIIKTRTDYDGNTAVRLLSCSTGKGEGSFAQILANELGVPVEAPDDIIWVRNDGTYTIGPTKYKNTGKMIIFYPERK